MLKYIGKRLLLFIPTIFIISVVIFFIIQLPPGDYATSYAAAMAAEGEIMTPEQIQELRMQFGLDKPWYIQYFNWMADIITKGDFGYSFEYGRAVWDVIAQYLPLTLGISFVILVFQYAVSLPIGIYCANHQYSVGDYIWSFIGFIGTATPNFLLAILVMYFIYVKTGTMYLGLFSTEMLQNGMRPEYIPEFLGRCLIPILVIGTSGTCSIIRTVRAQMLDEQARQYTLTARAKGLPPRRVLYRHTLRNAMLPIVTNLGMSVSGLIGGAVVIEQIFNWNGMGTLFLNANNTNDYPLMMGIMLFLSLFALVANLVTDLCYCLLDPRVTVGGSR